MRIRTANDLVSTVIAWLPLLAIVVAVGYFLCLGMFSLEERSFGTEFFVSNDATTNLPEGTGPSTEQILMDALSTGDEAQMAAALNDAQAQQELIAGAQAQGR